MFSKITLLRDKWTNFLMYMRTLYAIRQYMKKYPGMEDSKLLRSWIRPIVLRLVIFTEETSISWDDPMMEALLRILDSDQGWSVVYLTLQLIHGRHAQEVNIDTVSSVESFCESESLNAYPMENITQIAREMNPENPMLIIAGIGLLLQIIQFIRSRKGVE